MYAMKSDGGGEQKEKGWQWVLKMFTEQNIIIIFG